jgi:outer membrane protein assembly factor BamB
MLLLTVLKKLLRRPVHTAAPTRRPAHRPEVEVLEGRLCLSANLLVANFNANDVLAFNAQTGAEIGVFASGGGLQAPVGIVIGPDNGVYVSSRGGNDVLRYDGQTGAFLGTFVTPGSGGLNGPHGLVFGPTGDLFVNSGFNGMVLDYDGATGASRGAIVPQGSGGLQFPHGLTIGPDGDLYVADRNTSSVLRYDASTGAYLGTFVSSGSGGLNITTDLAFGPDGNLYVAGFNSNAVLRYDGHTGAFLNVFASGGGLSGPQGIVFGPDGNLYVASDNNSLILRYDGHTGAFLGVFASGGDLNGPTYMAFQRTDTTTAVSASVAAPVFGQPVTFTASIGAVTPNVNAAAGKVIFTIDGVAQAAVPVVAGKASLTPAALGVGKHTVTAAYQGDGNYNTSLSAPLALTVARDKTTTTLVSSANPAVVGDKITFTATVSAAAPGAGTPTGTVTFKIDGFGMKTVKLINGVASFTLVLPPGRYDVKAVYNGDGDFLAGTSTDLLEVVRRHRHRHAHKHHHHGVNHNGH